MLSSEFNRTITYIDWNKEATKYTVTQAEFVEIYEKIKANGNRVTSSKCKRLDYNKGDYRIETIGLHKRIYVFVKNGDYRIYSTNAVDDKKNDMNRITGPKAVSLFMDKFNEINGTNAKGFSMAFGTVDAIFKNCVPRSFYYQNKLLMDRVINAVSSIDACAHYPSNMCGRLPNARTAVKLKGCILPNKEYPFAFYLNSGHCGEYGVFNTMTWNSLELGPVISPKNLPSKDETTVLMKASEYTLDEVWNFFYNKRKEDEEAKGVMNCTIGMFHTKRYISYNYAHLAAIAIARANDILLKKANEIGVCDIIHIAVDGIIYRGIDEYGEKEKGLGKFYQEFTNAQIKVRSANCYIVKKDGEVIKVKHGCFNKNPDGTDIVATEVKDYAEMYGWSRDETVERIN